MKINLVSKNKVIKITIQQEQRRYIQGLITIEKEKERKRKRQ